MSVRRRMFFLSLDFLHFPFVKKKSFQIFLSVFAREHGTTLALLAFSEALLRHYHGPSAAASGAAAARFRGRATMASSASRCDRGGGDNGRPTSPPPPPPPPPPPRAPWRHVATAFVSFSPSSEETNSPYYALVRRSDAVSTYRGLWGAVSGGIEAGVDASAAARAAAEVEEEVGLGRAFLRLECRGRPLKVDDGPRRRFVVHPVRFRYSCCCSPGAGGGKSGGGKNDGGAGEEKKRSQYSRTPRDVGRLSTSAVVAALEAAAPGILMGAGREGKGKKKSGDESESGGSESE